MTLGLCLAGCGGDPAESTPAPKPQASKKASRPNPESTRLVHFSAPAGNSGGTRRGSGGDAAGLGSRTEPVRYREKTRVLRNQEKACEALWDIFAAQRSAHLTQLVDSNGDGTGEYLFFDELLGIRKVRGGDVEFTDNGNVRARFKRTPQDGRTQYHGYMFQVWLPGENGWETRDGASSDAGFRCYAWPVEFEETGKLAYCIDERGEVYASSNERTAYHGADNAPAPDAFEGELSDLHPDDKYLGNDKGWWSKAGFVPASPPR